jgi:hypothetical protein
MSNQRGKWFTKRLVAAAAVALISGVAYAGPSAAPFDAPNYHGSIERDIQSRALWAGYPTAVQPGMGDQHDRAIRTSTVPVQVSPRTSGQGLSPLYGEDPDMRGSVLYDVGNSL